MEPGHLRAPLDPQSNAFIDFIGRDRTLHPDFGPPPYGIPYMGVGGTEPRVPIAFVAYGGESDNGFRGETGYPVPEVAKTQPNYIEGGAPGGGIGWRSAHAHRRSRSVGALRAVRHGVEPGTGAMGSRLGRRFRSQLECTTPGRMDIGRRRGPRDSARAGALRRSAKRARQSRAARHRPRHERPRVAGLASAGSRSGALPMGARLRLKASKDISGYPAYIRAIFRAMQTYGLIVADNGSDMYITGAMDSRWNNGELNPAFRSLTAGDFEVIQLGWR